MILPGTAKLPRYPGNGTWSRGILSYGRVQTTYGPAYKVGRGHDAALTALGYIIAGHGTSYTYVIPPAGMPKTRTTGRRRS